MNFDNGGYVWYTEFSKQFLGRDYFLPGQTLDERITIIGDKAEKTLGIEGFSDKFKSYMKKGWISLSTPIWANYGTDRGLPISCVTGDTWVNTQTGGGKQARDIVVGDQVLTHKGRYRPVTKVMVTPEREDIYRLKVSCRMTDLYITGNHKVLTNEGWVETQHLNANRHLIAVNRELEHHTESKTIDLRPFRPYDVVEKDGRLYKAASDTVRKDRRKEVVSYCASPFADVIVDGDLAWALGLWFAEGSLSTSKGEPNGIRITVNATDEREEAALWLKIISDKFGVNGALGDGKSSQNGKPHTWLNVNVNSRIVGNYFKSFGNGCKEKTLPDWVLNLPLDMLQRFLDGLLLGDGSVKRNGTNRITLANPKLILQVYQIGLKLGKKMSLQMQEKASRLSSTKYVYTILFLDKNVEPAAINRQVPFTDGLAYCRIATLEKTDKVETVYDFTVEEDHSFSVAGVVVHNCFGSYIEDTVPSILGTLSEVGVMTKYGGGTSAFFGALRGRGSVVKDNGYSSGAVHFMPLYESVSNVISQGGTRRGSFAAYLPIDHPDIEEFLAIRSEGNPLQDISFGVTVPDYWMQEMIAGDKDKRKIWAKVLASRVEKGYPYIFFSDTVNKNAPEVYKDKNMKITHSNLCSEICLADDESQSFVCDLASLNLLHYDAWKDTDCVEVVTFFLDAVMTEFIEKAKDIPFMQRAVKFAVDQRAIGIGALGYHSLLQSKNIPFESMEAKFLNVAMFQRIERDANKASEKLAELFGEPRLLIGYGRRNTTLMAIAPTKSSAFILGQVSEGIEPHRANYYVKDLAKGKFTVKNPHLEALLESMGQNTDEVWKSILTNSGSVQHLAFLSDHEKLVYKTFAEISPKEVIIQASARQKFIDQSQSLNVMINPTTPIKDINALYILAWELGVKTLYYQLGFNAAKEFSKTLNINECVSCAS